MRRLAISVALALLVACSNDSATSEGPDSGIRGRVLAGPQCPVVVQNSPCPDQPVPNAGIQVSEAGSGEMVARVNADENGRFLIRLRPGRYVAEAVVASNGGPPSAKPVDVTVRAHEFTRVVIPLDTGIR